MTYTNLIFTCVFVIEAALKIMAFGAFAYFRDRWNAFDFFVVVISVASVVLDFSGTQNLSFMPVLRVLRVVRVVRLIRRVSAKGGIAGHRWWHTKAGCRPRDSRHTHICRSLKTHALLPSAALSCPAQAVGMRRLLLTLVQSLPALGNVGGVMVLL